MMAAISISLDDFSLPIMLTMSDMILTSCGCKDNPKSRDFSETSFIRLSDKTNCPANYEKIEGFYKLFIIYVILNNKQGPSLKTL
jgi:hypothetical protein